MWYARSNSGLKSDSRHLYRLIWFGCLSVCFPIILAGIAYYQFSMKEGLQQFQQHNRTSLSIVEQFTESIMDNIVDSSFQLAFDPMIIESFHLPDYRTNYVAQMGLLERIAVKKYQDPLIGNMYYFNRKEGLVLSDRYGFQRLDDFKYKADIEKLERSGADGQWIYLPEGSRDGYISFALKLPVLSSGESQGMLVTLVDASRIENYFSHVASLAKNQSITVIDPTGVKLFQTRKAGDTPEAIGDSALRAILSDSGKTNSFLGEGPLGDKIYYSFEISTSGNVYISAIPYSVIISELSWIRWMTIWAVLVFLSVGVLLTVVTLRRAYNPIGQFVDYLNKETKTLGEKLAQSVPPLMERLLQQWLAGNYIHSRTLYDECRKYGIPTDRIYVVVLVKVENLFKEERFRPEDKPMLTFALINVMGELLREHPTLSGNVLHDHQGLGTAILYFDRNVSPAIHVNETIQYASQIEAALHKYVKLQVCVGIGRFYPMIADIRLSYREAKQALQYRLYKEDESILYIDEMEGKQKQSTFSYPRLLESNVVDALSRSDEEEARVAMQAFTYALQPSESYAIISQSYQMLLASIIASIENKGGGVPDLLEYDLFDQLKARETIAEMSDWFIEILFPLFRKIADHNYSRNGKLIAQKARKYVTDNISKDISLAECADLFQVTPSHLSQLFKKEVGVSFLEYVTQCKINEARRLLTQTEQNISQIADAVGYSHRTFNRIFHRLMKMSPRDYRACNR